MYDWTRSYDASFYFAGILILLAGIVSCLIPTVARRRRQQLFEEHEQADENDEERGGAMSIYATNNGLTKLSVVRELSDEDLTIHRAGIATLRSGRNEPERPSIIPIFGASIDEVPDSGASSARVTAGLGDDDDGKWDFDEKTSENEI